MQVIYDKFIDSTIIKISKSLNVMMNCDKVLILDHGRIIEFGQPYQLIQNSKGHLRKLIEQTDSANMFELIRMAESNFCKQNLNKQKQR